MGSLLLVDRKKASVDAQALGIEAVGADEYTYGAKTTGSILVNRMKVAGS